MRRILLVDLVLATGADPLKSAMTSTCGRFFVEHLQVNGQTHVMVVKQPSLSRMGNASLQTSYTRGILATAINRSQKSAELTRLGRNRSTVFMMVSTGEVSEVNSSLPKVPTF